MIVDLSHNRIRKLSKEDLRKYSNLKMLYLNDNLITVIDKETFEGKDDLRTLDLSVNAISKLPTVLFHLPSLQSLYLGQNLNTNIIVDVVKEAKPITSPLIHLDISYMMSDEANELPDFGIFPSLEKYNISGNRLMSPTTKHFAGLCNLKLVDTTNVTLEYEDDPCDCWKINRWLKDRKIIFKPFTCTKKKEECSNDVSSDDLNLYKECVEDVKEAAKTAKIKTILLIVLPIIAIVLVVVAIYCFMKKRRQIRKKQRLNERLEPLMLNNVAGLKI